MKKIKGFTLIECLIALAILGIASLTMAQIYASISKMNMSNHLVNTSLSKQMEDVEEKTGTKAVKIPSGETSGNTNPPHERGASSVNYVTIERLGLPSSAKKQLYSYPVDCYVLLSRDADNKSSNQAGYKGAKENDIGLRYKFITGYTP